MHLLLYGFSDIRTGFSFFPLFVFVLYDPYGIIIARRLDLSRNYKILMQKKRRQKMKKMKRISTVLVLAMMLASIFSSSIAFAAMPPDNTASPNTIMTCARSFVATSSTRARAEVSATSSGQTPFITSEITLQSAPLGTTRFTACKCQISHRTSAVIHTAAIWRNPA